jgi:hypothetical protein
MDCGTNSIRLLVADVDSSSLTDVDCRMEIVRLGENIDWTVGEMVNFPDNGEVTEGYLALPESGAGLGVIVIQEWWGLVDHIKDVCDRFAAGGIRGARARLPPRRRHGRPGRGGALPHGTGHGPGGEEDRRPGAVPALPARM